MPHSTRFKPLTQVTAFLAAVALIGADGFGGTEAPNLPGPVKVELHQTEGAYQLFVDHKPFFIKGAGLEFGNQEKLAEHGGNSFRTWRTENGQETGKQILDRAFANHL